MRWLIKLRQRRRGLQNLFGRRHTLHNLQRPGNAQGLHAVLGALLLQQVNVGLRLDQLRKRLRDGQQFIQAGAAAVAGLAALGAAGRAVDGFGLGDFPVAGEAVPDIVHQFAVRRLALRA